MTDHLSALFLSSDRGGSHGRYEPGLFDLHLSGDDLADHMVHHHEAQHVLLTATTAWGAALLIAADMPVWKGLFERLLGECRSTHESFATYLSCSVLSVGRGSPHSAMAAYPGYRVWLERLERYLAAVTGARRRALAATALARACMQAPVLERMLRSWPNPISIGQIRRLDRPDERFEYLLAAAGGLPAAVVASADEAVRRVYGAEPLSADIADRVIALDDAFDPAWALWEETVCHEMAERLWGAGATVIDGNGYLDTATELFHLVGGVNPASRLGVDAGDPSDQQTARLVLSHARLWLSVLRRPGRLDDKWRRAWLPVPQKLGPMVWLIDVGISSLATELGGGRRVVTAQMDATPGIELTMTGADWSEYLPALRLVIADPLHTESYVDLRAAAGRPGREQ